MRNPGLADFSSGYVHPGWEDINDPSDPDFVDIDDDSEWGEFTRGHDFGRWRTPGQSTIRVPVKQGPIFAPGKTPEDVIHGEVISPREQDAADRIINGEHESDSPSDNPDVERARQFLRGQGADDTVGTLSGLLRGEDPKDVGGLDEAHDWLSRHFTGVRVNPHHGTLLAQSPAGTQLVRRQQYLPAIPQPVMEPTTYKLTNKHGDFESEDPQRIVRSMIAFQIVQNNIAAQEKKDRDSRDDDGLVSTSGFWEGIVRGLTGPKKPKPRTDVPPGAVWEPGRGNDVNNKGQSGGWVARSVDAPDHWIHVGGTAYSPGHAMRLMFDPQEAVKPRSDPRFPGHTFTYAPNPETGHTEPRRLGNVNYWVQPDIHPAARGAGFDLVPTPKVTPPGPGRMPRRPPAIPPHSRRPSGGGSIGGGLPPTTSAVQANDLCPVCASGYLERYDSQHHECLNCGSLVTHVGFERRAAADETGRQDWSKDKPSHLMGPEPLRYATQRQHDLLGELGWYADRNSGEYAKERGSLMHGLVAEPDGIWAHSVRDSSTGEEYESSHPDFGSAMNSVIDINNGANPKDQGYRRTAAARPKGGLGRGLKQIQEYEGDPLGLSNGGSENANQEDHPDGGYVHPLAGEQLDQDYVGYEAPRRILDKEAGELDPIEEFMGKQGFQPIHKPGQSRVYVKRDGDLGGAYWRLTEGALNQHGKPSGWSLTFDHARTPERWERNNQPYVDDRGRPSQYMPEALPSTKADEKRRRRPMRLNDLGEHALAQKSFVAGGSHPIEDDALNRAIRDVAQHGRNSQTYRKVWDDAAYEAPVPPKPGPGMTQRDLRGLSSVTNPGLARWRA